jgi:glucosamine--fructose-6-phosphate aminotransferase (isomerizing)
MGRGVSVALTTAPRETLESIVSQEIREGPAAIRETIDILSTQVVEIADAIRMSGRRRIWAIGNGSLFNSLIYMSALAQRLAAPDDPVVIPVSSAEFALHRPRLSRHDLVIGVSGSGACHDVVTSLREVTGSVPTIGITTTPKSPITRSADHSIVPGGGPSAILIKTKAFSATTTACALLMTALIDGPFNAVAVGLRLAADDAERAIVSSSLVVDQIAVEVADSRNVFVVGHGLAVPAALEAALKLKQIALVHAEAQDSWEMRSGGVTIVGPGDTIVVLVPERKSGRNGADLVRSYERWGVSQVVEVSAARTLSDSRLLPLPRGVDDVYAPLVVVPPVVLLAVSLARLRGENPDQPSWLSRYRQQSLLRHVVPS